MYRYTRITPNEIKGVAKSSSKVSENLTEALEVTAEDTAQKTTQKILDAMRENPLVTRQELAELIGITADGVKFAINSSRRVGGRESFW